MTEVQLTNLNVFYKYKQILTFVSETHCNWVMFTTYVIFPFN